MAFRAAEYSRFDGPRSNKPAWLPIFHATIRRGWSSKWVRRITGATLLFSLGCTGLIYLLYQVIPDWRLHMEAIGQMVMDDGESLTVTPESYLGLLYLFVYPTLMPLSLVFGYDLLASDIRSNAFESYFSRSITPFSYLFGRTAAYVCFLLGVTLLPMMWIWTFDVTTAPDGHFDVVGGVPWGLTRAMVLISLTLALMVQAVTTLTRSGIWTNLTFVGIFLFTNPLGAILAQITENQELLAIGFLHCVKVFCAHSLDTVHELRGGNASPSTVITMLTIYSGLSLAILLKSLKKRSLVG